METKERLGRKGSLGRLVVFMVWDLEVHSSNPTCATFWISSFFRRKKNQYCSTTGIVWYRKSGTESLYPLRPYPPFIQTLVGPTALFPRHFLFTLGPRPTIVGSDVALSTTTKGILTLSGGIHQVLPVFTTGLSKFFVRNFDTGTLSGKNQNHMI